LARIFEESDGGRMTIDVCAVGRHGAPLIGVAPLMRMAFAGEDLHPLGENCCCRRAQTYPNDAHAYMDFSTVLQLTGNRDDALAVQAEAIMLQSHYTIAAATREAGTDLAGADGAGRPDVQHAGGIPGREQRCHAGTAVPAGRRGLSGGSAGARRDAGCGGGVAKPTRHCWSVWWRSSASGRAR
jgi:hypothetical protein